MNLLFHLSKVRIRGVRGLLLLLLCLTARAQGQVTVDMRALDSMGPAQAAPAPARHPAAAPPPISSPHTAAAPNKPAVAGVSAPASSAAATQTSHLARHASASSTAVTPERTTVPPPASTTAQTPALPTEQPAAAPPAIMVPAPPPSPLPLPPPVRLVFEAGKTDLTPADEAAIQDLARAIPAPAANSVNVVAYAAGKPDDPSTARRLSLSRGLAVRSVLLASGVPSAQIYVRALGSAATDGPADRVELTVARPGSVTR